MEDVLQDRDVTKYQFQIDDEKWDEWKKTVPRSKSLETRIIELIEADTEGRVNENSEGERGGTHSYTEEETPTDPAESTPVVGEAEAVPVDRDLLREELSGSGNVLERRVDQIVAMYERLQELGTAEKDDLLEAVDVDATEYASKDSVWSNMVKGRDTLKALPGVEPPPTGRTEWKYKP
jgi:hypothetical protein